MSAVATPQHAEQTRLRSDAVLDRALAALPVAAAFLLLFVLYAWQARKHGSPWLFGDEIQYTELSRAIAANGEPAIRGQAHAFESLYSYVLAPVWWIHDTSTAYAAAKYLGVALMTSAFFPAYALARMLVSRFWALFAAVGTLAIPAMAYSRLLVTEQLAYPWAVLAFFVMAKTISTRSRRWLGATIFVLLFAHAVRPQLGILVPVFLVAIVLAFLLGEQPRRWVSRRPLLLLLPVALAAAAAGYAANEFLIRHSAQWDVAMRQFPHRTWEYGGWALGALVIGIGVFPAVAGIAALVRPARERTREFEAFVGVFLASLVVFVLYTAVKAAYLSTVFAILVEERNLLYLSPLFLVATAIFLERPRVRLLAVPVVAAVVGAAWYLLGNTPYKLDLYPYSDAPGLAILAELNRRFSLDAQDIHRVLLAMLVASVGIVLAASALRRIRPAAAGGLGAVVAASVVAWTLTGAITFGNGFNGLANKLKTSIPDPPTWIDRATGGAATQYLGQGIADPNAIQLTEFWNRSLHDVTSLDNTAPGPGPTPVILPAKPDGSVVNDPHDRYVVLNGGGIEVFGTLVERTGDWRLYRTGGRLRLKSAVVGVYPDGWIGASGSYARYGRGERGTLDVAVGRLAWTGPNVPAKVVVKVGTLVPQPMHILSNPCSNGVCVSQQPHIGKLEAVGRWTARSGRQRTFHWRLRAPFLVQISVSPTFTPHDYGSTDLRQLGVQVGFAFAPARK